MGRKKYEPSENDVLKVYQWACEGLTEKGMALGLGIGYSTFQRIKKEHFEDAIKRGKEHQFSKNYPAVVGSLIKRATGYEVDETTSERRVGADGKATIVSRTVKKHIPASEASMFFWLANRDPENWKNMQQAVTNKPRDITKDAMDLSKLSTEQFEQLQKLVAIAKGESVD